jgi:hypothetical protein
MLIYVGLFLLLCLFYNYLSSLLGPVYSLSKCLGLFIAKAFASRSGFSRPIPIKGRSWCVPVKQFKWRHPYAIIGERKLRVVYYRQ